jgi:hypothetical protein
MCIFQVSRVVSRDQDRMYLTSLEGFVNYVRCTYSHPLFSPPPFLSEKSAKANSTVDVQTNKTQ